MTNNDLIQRAERWLMWHLTRYAINDPLFFCQDAADLIRECVDALKADTPASTQANPSSIDLLAPLWIDLYASQGNNILDSQDRVGDDGPPWQGRATDRAADKSRLTLRGEK